MPSVQPPLVSFYRFQCCSVDKPQFDFLVVRESNVAIGKTATINSNYSPGNAIDGDLTTVTGSGQTDSDKWLTIDLQAPHYISRVVIYNGGFGKSHTAVCEWAILNLYTEMMHAGSVIYLPCNTRIFHVTL